MSSGALARQSFSWEGVTLSERHLEDGDLAPRTVSETTVTLQVSGPLRIEIGVDGGYQAHTVGPGSFCLSPAGGVLPAARWRGPRSYLTAEISSGLIRSVAESRGEPSFELATRLGARDAQVTRPLLALREELLSGNASGRIYVDALARAIVARLLQAHSSCVARDLFRGGLSRQVLRRVQEYMEANLGRNLGIGSLAAVCGLSEDHFGRAFRESTGVPPHRYLLRLRLESARRLLERSDRTIVEIACGLGFADQSHLTNLFRREMGITPGQLRKSLRNSSRHAGIRQDSGGGQPVLFG